MGQNKPWLRYHKDGAPAREFHEPKIEARQLFLARIFLIFFGHMGGHQIYLRKPRLAMLWFLFAMVYFVGTAILIESWSNHSDQTILSLLPLVMWFAIIAFEYRRLPKLVRAANIQMFGLQAKDDPRMQGEIGLYSNMKPIVLVLIVMSIPGFLIGTFLPNSMFEKVSVFVMLIAGFFAIKKYSKITKRIQEENIND